MFPCLDTFFSQLKSHKHCSCSLKWKVLQHSDHFGCPLLHLLQFYNILFEMRHADIRPQIWQHHKFAQECYNIGSFIFNPFVTTSNVEFAFFAAVVHCVTVFMKPSTKLTEMSPFSVPSPS